MFRILQVSSENELSKDANDFACFWAPCAENYLIRWPLDNTLQSKGAQRATSNKTPIFPTTSHVPLSQLNFSRRSRQTIMVVLPQPPPPPHPSHPSDWKAFEENIIADPFSGPPIRSSTSAKRFQTGPFWLKIISFRDPQSGAEPRLIDFKLVRFWSKWTVFGSPNPELNPG